MQAEQIITQFYASAEIEECSTALTELHATQFHPQVGPMSLRNTAECSTECPNHVCLCLPLSSASLESAGISNTAP